jgi:hypothetical protein
MILAMNARDLAKRCGTMANDNRELSAEELGSVTGGGLVDKLLTETEATTDDFLKRFADASQRFNAFINTPAANQSAPAAQE